jgi:hypothetical protein
MKIPGILWKFCGNLKSVDRSPQNSLAPPIPITDNEVEHRSSSSLSRRTPLPTPLGIPGSSCEQILTSAPRIRHLRLFPTLFHSRQSIWCQQGFQVVVSGHVLPSYTVGIVSAYGCCGQFVSASKHLLSVSKLRIFGGTIGGTVQETAAGAVTSDL